MPEGNSNMNINSINTPLEAALAKITPHLPLDKHGSHYLCILIATVSTSNAREGKPTNINIYEIVIDGVINARSTSLDDLLVKAINACDLHVERMSPDFGREPDPFTPEDIQQFADCSPNICHNN